MTREQEVDEFGLPVLDTSMVGRPNIGTPSDVLNPSERDVLRQAQQQAQMAQQAMVQQPPAQPAPPMQGAGAQALARQEQARQAQPIQQATGNIATAQAPRPQAPPSNIAQAQPQPGMSAGDAFRQGFGARSASMVAQSQIQQAQAAMAQFQVQHQMRIKKAQENLPQFKPKMQAVSKIAKQLYQQEKQKAKAQGLPEPPMTAGLLDRASQQYDQMWSSNPEMQISELDQDTMTLTGPGQQYTAELGILPFEELNKVTSQAQKAINDQWAQFQGSLFGLPNMGTLFKEEKHPMEPNIAGPPRPPSYEPSAELERMANRSGRRVDDVAAILTGGSVNVGGQFNAPHTRPEIAKGREFLLKDLVRSAETSTEALARSKAEVQEVPLTGEQANAEALRRMGPLVSDPEKFQPFDPSQPYTQKQVDQTLDELGKNIRQFESTEAQNTRQADRLQNMQTENDKNRGLKRELLATKNEGLDKYFDKNSDLKKYLQTKAHEHQWKLSEKKLTAAEEREHFRADSELERQRERLQTQAGINFTRDAIRSNPMDALKFAMEAEKNGNATTRGILSSILKLHPEMAVPLMEAIKDGKTVGTSTMDAVKGAVGDYMDGLAEGGLDAELQSLAMAGGVTDQSKRLQLHNIRDRFKKGSEEYQRVQDRIDAITPQRGGVTVVNNPLPPEGVTEGALSAVQKRQYQDKIIAAKEGVETINEIMKIKEPYTGIGGMVNTVSNFFQGTAFDLNQMGDNVEEGAFEKFLNAGNFKTEVEQARFLANTIKYAVARSREPGGRLSDRDIQAVNIGTSAIRSQADLHSALTAARSEMMRGSRNASDYLFRGGVTYRPTDIQKDNLIQLYATDPNIKGKNDAQLMEMIQASYAAVGVDAGNEIIKQTLRKIKDRQKGK